MPTSSRATPSTRQRVRSSTAASINRKVDDQIARNVRYYSVHTDEIDRQLAELENLGQ